MDTSNLLALELDADKAVNADRYTVQSRAQDTGFAPMSDVMGGSGIFWVSLGQRLDEIPKWNPIYPNWRDRYLLSFAREEPMIASAIYSMKTRMGTLNYNLNGPPRAKRRAQDLLNEPGLSDSLSNIVQKLSSDLDNSDNGAFLELWKPGKPDKAPPKGSQCVGFAHLDSRQCWRSFDPEFPVWYTNPITNEVRKLHRERVVYLSDNPQPVELARGLGFCAVSRALRMVRVFKNMQIFIDEKVSGRFTRALGAISGVSAGQVKRALEQHAEDQDNKGYVIYNDLPFLIDPSTEGKNEIKIILQDLASIPDGFVFRDDADLYAYILAFCFGVDAREFWPATQSGATKADATVQNMKARGRGIGNRIQSLEYMLRFALPESVEFEYDFTDDEQDRQEAEIHQIRMSTLSTGLRDGVINQIEYRAMAIADGIFDGTLLESLDMPLDSDSNPDNEESIDALETNTDNESNDADPTDDNPVAANKNLALKTEPAYRRSLRQLTRGLWTGDLGAFDFLSGMSYVVERNFTKAWFDGLKQWGLSPEDMSDAERERLKLEINLQLTYIPGLAEAIIANSKANGGKLFDLYDRLEMWVNQYGRIMSIAGTMAAADGKGKWVYGDTINHCPSCASLEGRVYRNSTWTKWLEPLDMMPRGKGLSCGGWQCDCKIEKTTDPITPGHPPIVKALHDGQLQNSGDRAQTPAKRLGLLAGD